MTKFEELCQLAADATRRSQAYRIQSIQVLVAVRNTLVNYLGCKEESVMFYPGLSEPEGQKLYGPAGALEIADDGWWHFGLVVSIGLERLLMRFAMKQKDDRYVLRPHGEQQTEFVVTDPKDDFQPVVQWVFNFIKVYYEQGLDRFLSQREKKAGFLNHLD